MPPPTSHPRAVAAALLTALALALGSARLARAQGGLLITSAPPPTFAFGQTATFRISAQTNSIITAVTLYYRPLTDDRTSTGSAIFGVGSSIAAAYAVDLTTHPLPPFAPVEFWWEVRDAAGARVTTNPQTFLYEDNRFAWQSLKRGAVAVHWYEGDTAFGQLALDTAEGALEAANRLLNAPAPESVNLYLYAQAADLRDTLTTGGRAWAGGHADPALGVAMVVVAPDVAAGVNLGRALPHELTHLLIYAAAGSNYARVPAWLNEGLAVMNQLSPDPGLPAALEAARDAGSLLSLSELCAPFPADPAQAQIAYAESESIVRYIRDRLGDGSLTALLAAYGGGADCAGGVQQALGFPLDELERHWLAEVVKTNPALFQLRALTPWLALTALVLGAPLLAALLGFIGRRSRMV